MHLRVDEPYALLLHVVKAGGGGGGVDGVDAVLTYSHAVAAEAAVQGREGRGPAAPAPQVRQLRSTAEGTAQCGAQGLWGRRMGGAVALGPLVFTAPAHVRLQVEVLQPGGTRHVHAVPAAAEAALVLTAFGAGFEVRCAGDRLAASELFC